MAVQPTPHQTRVTRPDANVNSAVFVCILVMIVFSICLNLLLDNNNNIIQLLLQSDAKKTKINCTLLHESLKYDAECESNYINISHIWPLLITATPRSGTVFMVHILQYLGIATKDDWHSLSMTDHAQISWIYAFFEPNEREYFGPSRLHSGRFSNVFHQIRDPLKSITSICTEPITLKREYNYVSKHVHLFDRKSPNINKLLLAMQFWYEWNRKLTKFGFKTFQIETIINGDNKTCINLLYAILGESGLLKYVNDMQFLNKTMSDGLYQVINHRYNSRRHRATVTWNELFLLNQEYALKIWHLANKYNYKYDWDYTAFNKSITNDTKSQYLLGC